MPRRSNDAMKNSLTDTLGAKFDSGTLKILDGVQPAAGGAETTVLATITLPADAFAAAASGSAAKLGTWSATASATGTATWFRLSNSGGTEFIDGDITATSGGGDLELDSTSITSGQTVTVSSFSISALVDEA